MNLLHLSPQGFDIVTFWCSAEKPDGCFVYFDGVPFLFAACALRRTPDGPHEVGLLVLPVQLYQYLSVETQDRVMADEDYEFVSNHHQVFVLIRKGGFASLPENVRRQLDELVASLSLADDIRQAIATQPHQLRW